MPGQEQIKSRPDNCENRAALSLVLARPRLLRLPVLGMICCKITATHVWPKIERIMSKTNENSLPATNSTP
jgi:hypothetical protein